MAPTRPVLLVRNYEHETLGIAPDALEAANLEVHVLDAWDEHGRPPIEEVSGVVMLGGAVNVDQVERAPFLAWDREFTRAAVDRGIPYLGVCLGAQILARALDRPVYPSPARELGFEPLRPMPAAAGDPLLSRYEDGDLVFHWHEDTLELPDGAELLATGDRVQVQAYRVGSSAWGVQFHFEIDPGEIELWLQDTAEAGDDLEREWGKSANRVREEAHRHIEDHMKRGREAFRGFADVVREAAG